MRARARFDGPARWKSTFPSICQELRRAAFLVAFRLFTFFFWKSSPRGPDQTGSRACGESANNSRVMCLFDGDNEVAGRKKNFTLEGKKKKNSTPCNTNCHIMEQLIFRQCSTSISPQFALEMRTALPYFFFFSNTEIGYHAHITHMLMSCNDSHQPRRNLSTVTSHVLSWLVGWGLLNNCHRKKTTTCHLSRFSTSSAETARPSEKASANPS